MQLRHDVFIRRDEEVEILEHRRRVFELALLGLDTIAVLPQQFERVHRIGLARTELFDDVLNGEFVARIHGSCHQAYRYLNRLSSAVHSTSASCRTNGDTSPSLTAVATVTGLVRNNQTVAAASTTTSAATAPNRLSPTSLVPHQNPATRKDTFTKTRRRAPNATWQPWSSRAGRRDFDTPVPIDDGFRNGGVQCRAWSVVARIRRLTAKR